MVQLVEVLQESFRLLLQEPKLFVPRLISTALSSIWLLALVSGEINALHALISLPVIGFLGVFVSVMVAAMVKRRNSDRILMNSFLETISYKRSLVIAAIFFVLTGFVISIPLSVSLYIYLTTGNLFVLGLGGLLTLLMLLVIGFVSYFLPISLYEKEGFLSGFKSSISTSSENAFDVSVLTVFSFVMLGVAALAGNSLEVFGAAGFLFGRMVSSVVSTYFFVVSPRYYLE